MARQSPETNQAANAPSSAERLRRAIEANSSRSDDHAVRLRGRKDGPYYIAPDSVEPSPSGMWSGLDPKVIEETARNFPQIQESVRDPLSGAITPVPVPEQHREVLEAGGDAAHNLLRVLERGL
jgi:hypothetical protein